MKSFDAVKTMREIRTQLSKRYKDTEERQFDDLRRIREKYAMPSSGLSMKRPAVAEHEATYGETDST